MTASSAAAFHSFTSSLRRLIVWSSSMRRSRSFSSVVTWHSSVVTCPLVDSSSARLSSFDAPRARTSSARFSRVSTSAVLSSSKFLISSSFSLNDLVARIFHALNSTSSSVHALSSLRSLALPFSTTPQDAAVLPPPSLFTTSALLTWFRGTTIVVPGTASEMERCRAYLWWWLHPRFSRMLVRGVEAPSRRDCCCSTVRELLPLRPLLPTGSYE
mmetsp:Transcript_36163/g.87283  ORF Transcript_36163/g.87283 Transcript_36163/m.87283 type:complete len:215 (-) Transcript_36163:1024-1668(-)